VVSFFAGLQVVVVALMMTRIDLFAFDGGYGSVPLMFNEVVISHLIF
jgi:chromate transport protein ChrA